MIIRFAVVNVMLAIPLFSSCISHTAKLPKDQVLLQADTMTKSALLERLKGQSLAVKTLKIKKSTLKASQMRSNEAITEYHGVNGMIAVDRPGHIRLELDKVTTLAQMVSDEKQYRVYIPLKGKFGIGDTSSTFQGAEFPYTLRPSHILEALFVDGEEFIGKSGIDAILTNDALSQPDGVHSFYKVFFVKSGGVPLEELWFDRTAGVMEVVRKRSYMKDGQIEADIRYSEFALVDTIPFPKKIVINRPVENYALELSIEIMELNKPIDPATFTLSRPTGVDEVDLNTGKVINTK